MRIPATLLLVFALCACGRGQPGGAFVQISAGETAACGVRSEGSVICWGAADIGPFEETGSDFVQVTAAESHSCARRRGGGVKCWGSRVFFGQTEPPDTLFKDISCGDTHCCGVDTEDEIRCWGSDTEEYEVNGQRTTFAAYVEQSAANQIFVKIASGRTHTCGLKSDDTVECWGLDVDAEECEDVEGDCVMTGPLALHYSTLSGGRGKTCGITTEGQLRCWGNPGRIINEAPDGEFVDVGVGVFHGCAIKADNRLICWGENSDDVRSPPQGQFRQVTSGADYSCGLDLEDQLHCWGHDHGKDR